MAVEGAPVQRLLPASRREDALRYLPGPDRHPRFRTALDETRASGPSPLPVSGRGVDLLTNPMLNKGTAFSERERVDFEIGGLIPPRVTTIEEQVDLEMEHVRCKDDDLERYIGLAALQDRNETLFYRLLTQNLEEFAPIVYTPTVGRACQRFSHIFRRPRGLWITPAHLGRIEAILESASEAAIRLIVVTDNERILGLGDQGAGGMAIPVGKLALYTAAAGIHPSLTLPVSLDVGTDNEQLLADPLYLGYRSPRLRGQAYDEVLEAFVEAVRHVFPAAVLQWEDFKQHNALRILTRYRHRIPSFNDDVQGTGATVLAGLLAARRESGGIGGDRFLILGAGAAGIGIARLLKQELASEGAWTDGDPVQIALMSSHGLLHRDAAGIADDQLPHAIEARSLQALGLSEADLMDAEAVARAVKPTVLIGTTGCAGTFTERLVREVGRHSPRPIVMPLSNPTNRQEADPIDIVAWTGGRAHIATGSPAANVQVGGESRIVGQANNMFVFPGIGLGAVVAEAREIPDDTFLIAARTLAGLTSSERLAHGALYPPIGELAAVARAIAIATVAQLRDAGYGRQYRDEEIAAAIDHMIWHPEYREYVPV